MKIISVLVPSTFDFTNAETWVDQAIDQAGLTIALKTTLKQYPNCIHWHLKSGKQKGTLEITTWSAKRQVWFSVHENRNNDWIETKLALLKSKLEELT